MPHNKKKFLRSHDTPAPEPTIVHTVDTDMTPVVTDETNFAEAIRVQEEQVNARRKDREAAVSAYLDALQTEAQQRTLDLDLHDAPEDVEK